MPLASATRLLPLVCRLVPLMLITGLVVSAAVAVSEGWVAAAEAKEVDQDQVRLTSNMELFRYYDEALTMSARLATATNDPSYADRYDVLVPKLKHVLAEAGRLEPDPAVRRALEETGRVNEELVAIERAALASRAAGRPAEGYALVTSDRYDALERQYRTSEETALSRMRRLSAERAEAAWARQSNALAAGTVAAIALLLTLTVSVLGWRRSRRRQLRDGARNIAILDSATVSFVELDAEGRVVAANRRAQQMAGWALSDVRGSRLLDVAAPPGNPDRDRWSALLDVALSGEESVAEEILSTVRGGQLVQTEVSMWPSTSEGGRVNVFIRNIADRVALVAQLREQALTDPLTGLPNRRALTEALAEASSSGERAALLFLDIDEFKVLNDAYGHGVGDQLLQAAAVRIGAAVAAIFPADRPARDGDRPARNGDRPVGGADILCARLGGDEFAVLLVGADCGRAELLADLLIATLAEPFELAAEAGAAVNVAASLGLARHDGQPVPVGGSGDLLADADLALYAAKAAGKSRWAEYDHALRETAIRRAAVERELRAGLPLGEIVPHYQPVVRIRDTAIVGVEALARWDHPTRGLLAPAAFIEVAEQSDLIIDLGASMLAQTCVQLAAWDRELGPLAPSYAAVNISARHLGRQELVLEIAELLRTHGLAPHRLVIEVTEAAIIEDTAVATRNLRGLAELGVRLAVDDFGTGHSSLARLGTLAVDILKIDRSFVVQMGNGGAPLVELTLGLARSLGLDVVAEGVETTTQHDHLDRLGCANAQGYLYARPSAPAEITEMCRERSRAATTR